jgi:hypothetical protein
MDDSILQKGNTIVRKIMVFIFIVACVAFLVQGINEVMTGRKVDAAKTVSLPELLTQKNTSGDVVKLENYAIDMKHRINALPEPGEKEDIHILVPLRPIGQEADAEIVALFVLKEGDYNSVQDALGAWKDSLVNLRSGDVMDVELLGLDELPGNVPNVVKKNNLVAKKVLVIREVDYIGGEFLLVIAGIMALVAFLIYRRVKAVNHLQQFSER